MFGRLQRTVLWEIYVPVRDNAGIDFALEHHKAWDAYVTEISNGLTLLKCVRGLWFDSTKRSYQEEMIPVRIACRSRDIKKIAEFSARHYEQKAIFYYRVSNRVAVFHAT